MRKILMAISIIVLWVLSPVALSAEDLELKDSLDFGKALTNNPANLLRGKAAGVRVSSTSGSVTSVTDVHIRGVNAIFNRSDALWIVDDAVLSSPSPNNDAFWQYGYKAYTQPVNNFEGLNAYDIESVEILKDVSSTSAYGNRGANGVIIIKTKNPASESTTLRWSSSIGVNAPSVSRKIFKPAISHGHYLSLGKRQSGTTCNMSAFMRKLEDVTPSSGSLTGGLAIKFETASNKVLSFGVNMRAAISSSENVAATAYYGDPSLTILSRNQSHFISDTAEGWQADYDDDGEDYRFISGMHILFTPGRFFSVKATGGLDFHKSMRGIWYGNGTGFGLERNGAAASLTSDQLDFNSDICLQFEKYYASRHHVKTGLDVSANGGRSSFNTMNGSDFFTHSLRAKGLSIMGDKPTLHSFRHVNWSYGAAFFADYQYDQIAGISTVWRLDDTPRYDGWNPVSYPAVEGSFDVKRVLRLSSFTTLDIKTGYGEAGRERYLPVPLATMVSSWQSEVESGAEPFYDVFGRLRSREWNAGVSMSWLNGRIGLYVAYYRKRTCDRISLYCFGERGELFWHDAPRTEVEKEMASLSNNGIETTLMFKPLVSRDMSLSIGLNGAYNANQITAISANFWRGGFAGDGITFNANALGREAGFLYGYLVDDDGNPLDMTRDGEINEYDKVALANSIPKLNGGVTISFSYKRVAAEVLVDGAAGFRLANLNSMLEGGVSILSSKYIERGDYLRLTRMSIGYDIPVKSSVARSLRLNIEVGNAWVVTRYGGWNPDVNSFGSASGMYGLDYGSMPLCRSFSVGISANL